MPELPEVQTVVTALQRLVGKRVGRTQVLRRDVLHGKRVDFDRFAAGRRIRAISRQAKRIRLDLGTGREIVFHLGMTGKLMIRKRNEPLQPHTHLRIGLAGRREELRFQDTRRFGGVWLLDAETPRKGRGLGPLGPDPLEMTLQEFRKLISRHRQIKALLLDQTVIGGLGNIYTDEALFRARIHPLRRASELSAAEGKRLYEVIRRTLQAAIKAGGSTVRDYRGADGEPGWFQLQLQAYGREGKPCRRCKTPLKRIQAAGRSAHICPKCQPLL